MKHVMAMLILTLLVSSVWAEIFRDNFNDGDLQGWTFLQGAEDGGIENGELVLGSPKVVDEAKLEEEVLEESEVIIAVDDIISSDYEVSVSLKISKFVTNVGSGATIGLRAHIHPLLEPWTVHLEEDERNKDARIFLYRQSYRFCLGNVHIKNNIHIQDLRHLRRGLAAAIQQMKVIPDERKILINRGKLHIFRLFDFELHKWYRLKIIAKGNRFQCFIDDKKMLDFLDDTYTAGRIYLSSGWGNRVHFDDFEVQYEALSVQPRKQLTTTWGEIKSSFH